MNTKLTLRLEENLIHVAKDAALRQGKSVSKIVGDFFNSLSAGTRQHAALPPITSSLVGVLKQNNVSKDLYRKHLRDKYL